MRRRVLAAAALLPFSALVPSLLRAQQPEAMAALLRSGGCVVLIRHAQTVAGVGDPPDFRMDLCSTQRNLSEEGRAQSRRMGEWFKSRGLQPRAVQSSAWCRCKDTADLAFGRHIVWPALNSFFGGRNSEPAQTAALRAALKGVPAGKFEVWVTHQVNITALTGESTAMGEALVLDAAGKVLGRTAFS
jgi:phosphohistidine phosphatase SixA